MKPLLGFLFSLPLLAAPPLTIEQALSAPFPYAMVASPKGNAVAWVQDAAGVRNIWFARAPDFQARQATQFTTDDGQELGDLSWDSSGSALAFTRGEGPNGLGEIPNPHSNPEGAHQEVWLAPPIGKPQKLGEGNSPAISPDGSMVVWLHGGQIWSQRGPLLSARGSVRSLAWSPDGTQLAFTSDRSDHTFIGVYDKMHKTLRYLDPSVDKDRSPAWSPDGQSIVFIRIPASREAGAYGAKRTGQPWSIRVADLESGKSREIWRAQEGPGSVFWPLAASDQLHWTSTANIVFPWEHDGWQHLYSVPSKSGSAVLLTPGAFEVDNVTITPDRKSIVFSSNQNDIDRRHLWQVAADGGVPAQLTFGNGIEWSPASLDAGRIAFLHADKTPARAALLESAGNTRDFSANPALSFDEPRQVIFASADGMQIHGQLFLPPGAASGKHPAVVFFHGGSRRQMLLGWHPMQYYNQAYGFNQYLAGLGYVVLAVNYRSGIGYGTDFREALHFGPTGASEFNDVMGAAHYLQSRPDVDPARIGAWGGSYGGYLTALALARASNLFAVGVDLHGIYDWNLELPDSITLETKRLARESSPIAAISTWKSPVLLIQGDDDRNVAFSQTVQNVEALRKQGVPFEQLIFPDEVHEFLLHSDWLTAYHAADQFLARYLKP